MRALINYKKNITSYDGEDGIIEEIFKRIGIENRYCMEFGARDGYLASNTFNLINNGWNGILIEPNKYEFAILKNKYKNNPKVNFENVFVNFEGINTVDKILERYNAPKNIDFLNIDIDSFDYYVFESVKIFSPRVICIEYNSGISLSQDFVQPKDAPPTGSSLSSIKKLGESKGYVLVYAHADNAFFVKKDIYDLTKFEIFPEDFQTVIIKDLTGSFFLTQNNAIILIPNIGNKDRIIKRFSNNSDPNVIYFYDSENNITIVPISFYNRKVIRKIKNIVRDSFMGNLIYPLFRKIKNNL